MLYNVAVKQWHALHQPTSPAVIAVEEEVTDEDLRSVVEDDDDDDDDELIVDPDGNGDEEEIDLFEDDNAEMGLFEDGSDDEIEIEIADAEVEIATTKENTHPNVLLEAGPSNSFFAFKISRLYQTDLQRMRGITS